MSVSDGVGTGEDVDSSQINIIPLLISGTHSFERLPKDVFGYSLVARNYSSIKSSARHECEADVIPVFEDGIYTDGGMFAGRENYIGQYLLDSKLTETWGGLSWARRLNDNFAIGSTLFLAMRNQSQNQRIDAFAVDNLNSARSAIYQNVDYWNIRGLLKFGVAADFDALKLGLSMTTPSVNLFGKGTVAGEISSNNVWRRLTDENGRESLVDLTATDRQDDLDVTYKTPFSIAAGAEYTFGKKTTVGLTVEWFDSQSSYDVISPDSKLFLYGISELENSPEFNSNVVLKVNDRAKEVLNAAVGIGHVLTDKLKGYLSFRTDYGTNDDADNGGIGLGISDWDIYHVTLGGTYMGEQSEIALGMTYSFGKENKFSQFANLSGEPISEDALVISTDGGETSAKYNAWNFIIGYTYYFDK